MRKALLKVNEIKLGIKKVICRHMYPFHVLIVVIVASALREEIFAGINFREFFCGNFAGINFHELGFNKYFAGISFRELSLTEDFAGINFRKCALYTDFMGVNFAFFLKNFFFKQH